MPGFAASHMCPAPKGHDSVIVQAIEITGGRAGTRTPNPPIKSQLFCQLSYTLAVKDPILGDQLENSRSAGEISTPNCRHQITTLGKSFRSTPAGIS